MPENKTKITIEAEAKGLADINKSLQDTGKESQKLGGILSALKATWAMLSIGINQALELFNKVIAIPRKMVTWGEMGAQVLRTEQAFRSVASSAGRSADEIVAGLVRASRETMDATDVMQRAGRLMQEGIAPEKITQLMEYLQKQAPVVGDTIQEAWEKIGVALTTGNMRMVKQYIGLVDVERELSKYAASLGVSRDRLSEEGKQAQIFEIVLGKMRDTTKDLTSKNESFSTSIAQSKAKIKNAWEEIYKSFVPFADLFLKVTAASLKAIAPPPVSREYVEMQERLYGYSPQRIQLEEAEKKSGEGPQETRFRISRSAIAPRTPEQEREFLAFRLSNEAQTLELSHQQEASLKKRQEAELAGEIDSEKKAAMKIRHAAELKSLEEKKYLEIARLTQNQVREEDTLASVMAAQASVETEKEKWKQQDLETTKKLIEIEARPQEEDPKAALDMARELVEVRERQLDLDRQEVILKAELGSMVDEEDTKASVLAAQESRERNKAIIEIKELHNVSFREAEEIKDLWDGVGTSMSSAMQAGFFDLYKNGLTDLKGAFRGFLDHMVNSWYRALAQMASNSIMFGNMGGYKGAGNTAGLMGLFISMFAKGAAGSQAGYSGYETATVLHEGTSQVPRYRIVPAALFASAPRLHDGLKSGEYPAVLEYGEEVRSRREVAERARGNQTLTIDARTNITGPLGYEISAEIEGAIERIVARKIREFSA